MRPNRLNNVISSSGFTIHAPRSTIHASGTLHAPRATHSTTVLEPEVSNQQRLLPPYNVILMNDDDHSMDFVIEVLRKVFGFDMPKCVQLMLTAHETGLAI